MRLAALVMVMVMVTAAACGGGSEPVEQAVSAPASAPTAAASFDPCSLMTREEVQAAVGWTVTATKPIPRGATLGRCVYTGEGMSAEGPRQLELGVNVCFSNMPCGGGLPAFANSAEMAAYRRKGYEGSTMLGDMKPAIEPLEGLGVPAIRHDLAGLKFVEMGLGPERLASVELWGSSDAALALAKQLLTRVPK